MEKTARYQQKLEEKQADNLRTIKEKESQVKAKRKLSKCSTMQESVLLEHLSLHSSHTHTSPTPQIAEEVND